MPRTGEYDLIGLVAAAKLLGLPVAETKARAQDGRLPAIETAKRWWFRRDLIELAARATAAAQTERHSLASPHLARPRKSGSLV